MGETITHVSKTGRVYTTEPVDVCLNIIREYQSLVYWYNRRPFRTYQFPITLEEAFADL
jgi:hypothetical protein